MVSDRPTIDSEAPIIVTTSKASDTILDCGAFVFYNNITAL